MHFQTSWDDVNREANGVLPPKAIQLLEERDIEVMDAFATSVPLQFAYSVTSLATNTWSAPAKVQAPMWFPKVYTMDDSTVPNWHMAIFNGMDVTPAGGATTLTGVDFALVPHGGAAPTYSDASMGGPASILAGAIWRFPTQVGYWGMQDGNPTGADTCDLYVRISGTAGRTASCDGTVLLVPTRYSYAQF